MSRRENRTSSTDLPWLKELVHATWCGIYRWRQSGSRWVTKYSSDWRLYLCNSRLIWTRPQGTHKFPRWIESYGAAELAPLYEAIIFSREETDVKETL